MAHDEAVSVLYPVADNAEQALAAPKGRAARVRDARRLAGGEVVFVTEKVGPDFATRDAALDANVGRLDDERPGRVVQVPPEDRYCAIVETAKSRTPAPVEPAFVEGRRWPIPARPPRTSFRLAVSYWRVGAADAKPAPQARAIRRKSDAAGLDASQLRALAQTPLRPVKPQQPLDIGLFEAPAPEAPHILIPDE
jgi:hypothetical protein